MAHCKKIKFFFFTLFFFIFESALALIITIENPPQNYRIYTHTDYSQQILHSGSTRGLRSLSFYIPDRYAQGLNPNTDWRTILNNWRMSSHFTGYQPTLRNGVSYFPFTDSSGQLRFIALEHLLARQQRYPQMTVAWEATSHATATQDLIHPRGTTSTLQEDIASDNPETLYIGDSHSTNPGFHDTIMQRLGTDTNYYASCGANSNHWRTGGYSSSCGQIQARITQPLAQLQQSTNAEKVIINLGDNHISWSGSNPRQANGISSTAASDFRRLVETLPAHVSCYWVGPVWGSSGSTYNKPDRIVNEIYNLLQQSIGSRCTIVDCRDSVNRNNVGDGLHYNDSRAWAQCIADRTSTPQENLRNTENTVAN